MGKKRVYKIHNVVTVKVKLILPEKSEGCTPQCIDKLTFLHQRSTDASLVDGRLRKKKESSRKTDFHFCLSSREHWTRTSLLFLWVECKPMSIPSLPQRLHYSFLLSTECSPLYSSTFVTSLIVYQDVLPPSTQIS